MNQFRFLLLLLVYSRIQIAYCQTILRSVADKPIYERNRDTDDKIFCESWRFSVETNNAGVWKTIPKRCFHFVSIYMENELYTSDSATAASDSILFAKRVSISGDEKDIWIFDVDETLLSNLPYYREHDYGLVDFNESSFDAWVTLSIAPALPESLRLYKELQRLGFKLILLTGRSEDQRNVTEKNLFFAGYDSWERLILRKESDLGKPAIIYKSEKRKELEAEGYRIHGNSGDQWSDLIGAPMATRSFKLPNPMYFIP